MDLALIETLKTNKVLRDELNSEVNINILNEKKIRKYLYELEQCNKTISFQDSTIIAQESEIQELKSRVLNLKKRLRIALEDVKKKESYILYLEQELINLEDEINRLKTRIQEICSHRNILEDNTDMTQRPPQPPVIEIRQNYEDIQKHLDDVRLYFQNRIQVPFSRDTILKKLGLISTSANRLQEIAQNNQPIDQRITQLQNQYDTSQGILNLTRTAFTNEQQERRRIFAKYTKWKNREKNSRQTIINLRQQIFVLQNNPLSNPNMAAIQDVMQTISPRLAILPDYDGQELPHTYYTKLRAINETARPLGVAAFNDAERANVMKSKMTGRFFSVPAQNPYNANANIITEAEVYNWMQGKYRETMIGNQRASLKSLMSERFTLLDIDTIDTYEKRIRPYVLGIVDGEVLPYLYDHLPPRLETRIRIANPNTVNDLFTQLRIIWLESGGSTSNFGNEINTSASAMPYSIPINQFPQKNIALEKFVDIAIRLGYSGDLSDPIAIHQFVENDLTRNYGRQSNHIKKEPFGQNNNTKKVYAIKKPQKPTKVTYRCSNCEKIGHKKNKCPKLSKKPKKVNYTYQSEPENSDQEDEPIEVLEDEDEENNEEDEESIPDTESQNCFNVKKKSDSLPHCSKEILIETRVFLNNLFIKMKDQFDSYYDEKYTVKERNKNQTPNSSSHKETNRDYELISSSENLVNSITCVENTELRSLNHAIKVYQGAQIRQNWPNPFEIDFLDIKEPNDVATISCRIGDLIIPHAILDTGADDSLFTDNIPEYLGIKIDTKNVHKLTGAVGDSQSIGTSYNIPISIDSRNDSITVSEKEISVIPTKKDRNGNDISIMILGTKWQHRAGWDPILRSLNHAIKVYQGAQIRQNWPNPFEIDFLDIKEPNDVATISCRIGDLIIPHAILDTGADDSLFTDNIPEYLGIKIDTKNVHKLTGAVGDSQSIGTSYNIPISIDSRNDSITVSEKEISVIPTKKDRNGNDISIMILGTKWQHRAGWDPIVKSEFIATHNGKTIIIPLSTRKEKYSHNPLGNSLNHVTASDNIFNTEKKTNVLCSDTDTIKKITGTDI
ncbi:hypothetical protein Glove_328g70 [Diversispora epigaea]|uniref:CCHC-type domain-containing protein n=1 Tax=Diversispora epigaea TaxID=1348612 RepID=A0A397HKV1_9GLOM|nr:hypothetical protein Glove_328g70 [Diversispora epigaea]